MGRSGYEMPNHRSSMSDPDAPPPRRAGVGLIGPSPSWSAQHDPKGKGKERADAPSASSDEARRIPNADLPPVRRSADFREAVIKPFLVRPESRRRHRGFGLDVGPRTYTPAKVGAGGGGASRETRARPRALELGAGSSNSPIDVDMGDTSASSSAGPGDTGGGDSDDDLQTPRPSQFAVPDFSSRTASRPSQHPLQPQHSQTYYQEHRQYGALPAPRSILASQASQFGSAGSSSSSNGGCNFRSQPHSQAQGSHSQPSNLNAPPSVSSRRNAFASDTAGPSQLYGSSSYRTGTYDLGPSFSSSSFGMNNARGMATPNPGSMGYPPGLVPMSAAASSTPRTAIRPPPGFPPSGSSSGFGHGQAQGLRLEDRNFPFFPPQQPPTQAEKDLRRKAALGSGFEELLAKRQKRNH